MAIKAKESIDVVNILTTDTVVFSVPEGEKICVDAINAHNTSGVDVSVTFYISNDDTSASGDEVSSVDLSASTDEDINAIVCQAYTENKRIIAKADVAGVNISMTYTLFTGEDV